MTQKKLVKLLILCAILLLLVIAIATLLESRHRDTNHTAELEQQNDSLVYDFKQAVDMNQSGVEQQGRGSIGTDVNYGVVSDYYSDADVHSEGLDLYLAVNGGYEIISMEWKEEGCAKYINEPDFGLLEKFKLSTNNDSIEARYREVTMQDVLSYIREVKLLGFNEVSADEKEGNDSYLFSARNTDKTVTLIYQEGTLFITVYYQ